jgi:hypothetical protein
MNARYDPYRGPRVDGSTLAAPFTAELVAELEPGERVLWSGVPRRIALVGRALSELVMPLAFNGFVLALIAICSQQGGSLALCAVPLLALGLPLFRTPVAAWQAMRTTFYVVTDRRALVFDADAIVSIDRRDIVAVHLRGRAGGVGDIAVVARAPCCGGAALVGVMDARTVAAMLQSG